MRLFLQIDVDSFFTFRDKDFAGFLNQQQGLVSLVFFFLGVNFRFRTELGFGKKLLRFYAGLSARAVVAPLNVGHDFPFDRVSIGDKFGFFPTNHKRYRKKNE